MCPCLWSLHSCLRMESLQNLWNSDTEVVINFIGEIIFIKFHLIKLKLSFLSTALKKKQLTLLLWGLVYRYCSPRDWMLSKFTACIVWNMNILFWILWLGPASHGMVEFNEHAFLNNFVCFSEKVGAYNSQMHQANALCQLFKLYFESLVPYLCS